MIDSVTEEDISMIKYFIEKGDIERWCDWEKRKPVIQKCFPELIHALEQIKIAERTLSAVVENLSTNS